MQPLAKSCCSCFMHRPQTTPPKLDTNATHEIEIDIRYEKTLQPSFVQFSLS